MSELAKSIGLEPLQGNEIVGLLSLGPNKPALALYEQFGFVAYRRGTIGPETLELVKLRDSAP